MDQRGNEQGGKGSAQLGPEAARTTQPRQHPGSAALLIMGLLHTLALLLFGAELAMGRYKDKEDLAVDSQSIK